MKSLDKTFIERLYNIKKEPCFSIYLPTHRDGHEVWAGEDQRLLKSKRDDIHKYMEKEGYKSQDIKAVTDKLDELIQDESFWGQLSDGLAIYASTDFFEYHLFPKKFEEQLHIDDQFSVKPLMSLLNGDGEYFILALSLNEVKMYLCSQNSITNIKIKDLIPDSLEAFREKLGTQNEKHLDQAGKDESLVMQGFDTIDSDKESERDNYLRAIDDGLQEFMHDEYRPLIIAGTDEIANKFKNQSDYDLIVDEMLIANPEGYDMHTLHDLTWKKMKSHFDKPKKQALNRFAERPDEEHISSDVRELVKKALQGRVDQLLIKNGASVYGNYDLENDKIDITDSKDKDNMDLLEKIAIDTLDKGGQVFAIDEDEMPVDSPVAANLRF